MLLIYIFYILFKLLFIIVSISWDKNNEIDKFFVDFFSLFSISYIYIIKYLINYC